MNLKAKSKLMIALLLTIAVTSIVASSLIIQPYTSKLYYTDSTRTYVEEKCTNDVCYRIEAFTVVAEPGNVTMYEDISPTNNETTNVSVIVDIVKKYVEELGYKYLKLIDLLNNTTTKTLVAITLVTKNTSINSLESILGTFNEELIEKNIQALSINLRNYTITGYSGPYRVDVLNINSSASTYNFTIVVPLSPIIPVPPNPPVIEITEQRNITSGYMTVVLPYPTVYYWWFRVYIKGLLFGAPAYEVNVFGIIARRAPALALRILGIKQGEIIGADGWVSCVILNPRIAMYTIRCLGTNVNKIILPTAWYSTYGAGLIGIVQGTSTIGVYAPLGWWEVPVAIFVKGGRGILRYNGYGSVEYIG